MEKILVAAALLLLVFGCIAPAVKEESEQVLYKSENLRNDAMAGAVTAGNGDTVYVDYTGKLENGKVFDTSIQSVAVASGLPLRSAYEPLKFTVGGGQMIAGFDAGVVGMAEGQEKTIRIPPEKAYGEWSKENVVEMPLSSIIQNSPGIKLGSVLMRSDGRQGVVTGMANTLNDTMLTVDFNHELAGKTLVFSIKMVKIEKKG